MKLRSLFALILVFALLLSCIGCAEEEKISVTIWHTFTKDQEAYLVNAARDFNAMQDKYEVEVLSQAYSGFTDSVKNAVKNGVGPDIIFNYASEAADYVELGLLADLSQFIYDEETGIKDFEASMLQNVLDGEVNAFIDGIIHYLPAYTTGPILYYNKTLYDELGLAVPNTWDEVTENCKVIKAAKDIPGLGFDSLTDCIQMFIMEDGCGYIDVENKRVTFNTESMQARIQWLVDCVKAGYFTIASSGNYFSSDFNSGIVASYIGSCAGYPYIEPNGFEFGLAPMPGDTWYPSWNRGPIAFYYDDARAEGAYEFIKYFISPEVNLGWVKAVVALSPYSWTKELAEYQEFAEGDTLEAQSLQAVAARLDIAGSLPIVTGAGTVRTAIVNAVKNAVNNGMTVADAWNEAELLCNAALRGE